MIGNENAPAAHRQPFFDMSDTRLEWGVLPILVGVVPGRSGGGAAGLASGQRWPWPRRIGASAKRGTLARDA